MSAEKTGAPEQNLQRRPRRRRRTLVAGVVLVLVLAAAGVVIAVSSPFGPASGSEGGVADNAAPASLATVREGPLSSQVNQSGTLVYAAAPDGSSYTVINQDAGTFSALPSMAQLFAYAGKVDGTAAVIVSPPVTPSLIQATSSSVPMRQARPSLSFVCGLRWGDSGTR